MLDFLKRRPDFLILGAQKAGTSSLEFFLSQHPQIKCAKTKEVGFFSRDQLFHSGPGWYARQFPRRTWPGTLLFEATPEYLYYPFAAERIREFNPRMKCLILLRNPVNRAFSAWNMFRQFHSDPLIKAQTIRDYLEGTKPEVLRPLLELLDRPQFPDFATCAQAEMATLGASENGALEPSFIRRGLYWQQIQRVYQLFPKENILVLESTDLRKHRVETLQQALRFLGVPEANWDPSGLPDQHVREYGTKLDEPTRQLLQEFYKPQNAKLYALLGREFDWDA